MAAFPYDIPRGDWEEPGFTIAEHTNSPTLDWSGITNITIHFPGTPREIGRATREAFIANLRSSQRYYVAERDYSYGYNAAVWDALTAEIRGEAFRCAANGGTATNPPSFAVQVRSGGSTSSAREANADEIASIRKIVAWAEGKAGRRLDILGHRDHKPTGCPGDAIYAQIKAGVFRPDYIGQPEPEEPTVTRYFTTPASDIPVWRTDNGLDAHWVNLDEYISAGTPTPERIGAIEAAKFRYFNEIDKSIVLGV